jgi:hypothetical protein
MGQADAKVKYCRLIDSIVVGLNRLTAFHHMKFDPGGNRARRRNVNCIKQEVLEVECEKSDRSTRQLFSPTYNLMLTRKVSFDLPHASAVFGSKDRTTWVFDYFKSCLIGDLKSIAYQRRFEITTFDCDFFGRKFREWRLCGKRLVAVNCHKRQRFGGALRTDIR